MTPPIDDATVRHIAGLARLRVSDDEVATLSRQLGTILDYVRSLNQVNTRDVPPTFHPAPLESVLRDDEPLPTLAAEQALSNAPATDAGFFVMPKVLEQGGA